MQLWRFDEARRLLVPRLVAQLFAESDGDLHRLGDLVGAGCDPELAARILM